MLSNLQSLHLPPNPLRLHDPPTTPFEFHRNFISQSKPALFKSGGIFPSISPEYRTLTSLTPLISSTPLSINITPSHGKGDYIDSGRFIKPYESTMSFSEFTKSLFPNLKNTQTDKPVYYLSSQNSNLSHLPINLPTPLQLNEAFSKQPEAVNIWIGDGRAYTTCHRDVFENVYVVCEGVKRFRIAPPYLKKYLEVETCTNCSFNSNLEIILDDETPVKWISNDLKSLQSNPTLSPFIYEIDVREGEVLYLPFGWFHEVESVGINVSYNWWFDGEYDLKWTLMELIDLGI
ncbi:hypothetical protein TL16_g05050 [Triparma laevis f. inornata]|uniref:JmjC domain-containing protein n=1 Tax=Triparma laevis f. inornata TaxID=1714386 RepID=A0A9W7AB15_9STRA|nr:hypothetical protein TL16_g05050 [Triparma laevis f. inornata]